MIGRIVFCLFVCLWSFSLPAQDKSKNQGEKKAGGQDKEEQKKRTLPTPAQVLQRLKPSIAIVEGQHGHGTGFVVLPNVIATNAHVIRNELMKDIKITFVSANGAVTKLEKVDLLWEDKDLDLALLRADIPPEIKPLRLNSKFEPNGKRKVYIIGNPGQQLGVSRINSLGEGVAEEIVLINTKTYMQLKITGNNEKIDVGPGNSGGPVVDAIGLVIGVLTMSTIDVKGKPAKTHFCIPTTVLQKAVDGLGPADQWDEKIQKAIVMHGMDIVVVQLHMNARLSQAILQARIDLDKSAREEYARFPTTFKNQSLSLQFTDADKRIIDIHKEIDAQCQKLISGPFQAITQGKQLPSEVLTDLNGMKSNIDQLRKLVQKAPYSQADYQSSRKCITNGEAFFERLKKRTGLNDEIVEEMLKTSMAVVQEKLNKNKVKLR